MGLPGQNPDFRCTAIRLNGLMLNNSTEGKPCINVLSTAQVAKGVTDQANG
jgi:hypothetical protein